MSRSDPQSQTPRWWPCTCSGVSRVFKSVATSAVSTLHCLARLGQAWTAGGLPRGGLSDVGPRGARGPVGPGTLGSPAALGPWKPLHSAQRWRKTGAHSLDGSSHGRRGSATSLTGETGSPPRGRAVAGGERRGGSPALGCFTQGGRAARPLLLRGCSRTPLSSGSFPDVPHRGHGKRGVPYDPLQCMDFTQNTLPVTHHV